MEFLLLKICTIFFYASLALELTIWHVPSVASSRGILASEEEIVGTYSAKFQRLFGFPLWQKILYFILPLGLVYVAYFYPFQIIFDFQFGLKRLFNPSAFVIYFGCILIVFGRFISLSSVLTIRKENQQKDNSFKLHTDGFFSRLRNPGLMGLYISFIGFWLVLPNLFFAICLCIYFGYMHFKVLMEEDFLRNKFGVDYERYFATTNRYL